jgi:hypothetical protein
LKELFTLSSTGENRAWGGINSNFNPTYYYPQIPENIKDIFDQYIDKYLKNDYLLLKIKYNI